MLALSFYVIGRCVTLPEAVLQQHRDAWIDEVCADVLDELGEVGEELEKVVRKGLGPVRLTAALLAAWVADHIAGGEGRWRMAERVFASRVLSPKAASEKRILRLVDQVEAALSARGLPVGDRGDPRSGFMFLLEVWTVEQKRSKALADKLRRHWDTTDPRVVRYLLGLQPEPLVGYRTMPERVEADGRELVQAIVAQAFTDERLHAAREDIMDAMRVVGIEHLRGLAVDVTSAALAGKMIRRFGQAAHTAGKHEVAIAAAGAQHLVEEVRQSASQALTDMTAYEVSRLRLDPDHHFQTACLDAFISRCRTIHLDDDLQPARGTFGPLPWWRVVVDDDNRQHSDAILAQAAAGIGLRHDEGTTTLSLHLYDPDGAYFYTFSYSLDRAGDALEVLLLGRTERIGIDFDADFAQTRVRLGTYGAPLPEDLSQVLRDVATSALRRQFGFGDGYQPYAAVRAAAESALLGPAAYGIWSRPSWTFGRASCLAE